MCTITALSYRRFWTSQGRPSEQGNALDTTASAQKAPTRTLPNSTLMLWGQSLGAGVGTTAAAAYLARYSSKGGITLKSEAKRVEIKGLVLEKPFRSGRAMLVALYP